MNFYQFTVVQKFLSNFWSVFVNVFVDFVNLSNFCQYLSIFLKGQSLRIRQPLRFIFPSFTFNLFPSSEHVSHIYKQQKVLQKVLQKVFNYFNY
jgi:hypothetical protein